MRLGAHTIRSSVRGSEGVPLLLVNGLGAALETWEPFRDAIGNQCTIAFDAPGTGGSSTSALPISIRDVAIIARDLVGALGFDQFDVLGYSFGGAVAQEIARAAPSPHPRKLILVATNCGWGSPFGDPRAIASAAAGSASLVPKPDALGYWWQLVSISMWSSFAWLATLQQPTLVLAGDNDLVAPRSASEQLVTEIPNAELEVVPDAEHWFLMSPAGAAAAAKRVTAFLQP